MLLKILIEFGPNELFTSFKVKREANAEKDRVEFCGVIDDVQKQHWLSV